MCSLCLLSGDIIHPALPAFNCPCGMVSISQSAQAKEFLDFINANPKSTDTSLGATAAEARECPPRTSRVGKLPVRSPPDPAICSRAHERPLRRNGAARLNDHHGRIPGAPADHRAMFGR